MPVLISQSLLLSSASTSNLYDANSPRIGIENLTNQANIDGLNAGALPSNPAWLTSLPSMNERWITDGTSNNYLWAANMQFADVDYIGIAGHRGLINKQIEILYTDSSGLNVIYGPVLITDSSPIFINFDNISPNYIIIKFITAENFSFEIANIYVGKSVALPRKIYVGHTPITLGYKTNRSFNVSDAGNFNGQTILSSSLESSVSMDNIPPDIMRNKTGTGLNKKFIEPARTRPFFWAWRPSSYPDEVGYCSLMGDVQPPNSKPNGYMSMSFNMKGFVLNE